MMLARGSELFVVQKGRNRCGRSVREIAPPSTSKSMNVATIHFEALAMGIFSCNSGAAGPLERTTTLPKFAVPKIKVTFEIFAVENILYTPSHALQGWRLPPLRTRPIIPQIVKRPDINVIVKIRAQFDELNFIALSSMHTLFATSIRMENTECGLMNNMPSEERICLHNTVFLHSQRQHFFIK